MYFGCKKEESSWNWAETILCWLIVNVLAGAMEVSQVTTVGLINCELCELTASQGRCIWARVARWSNCSWIDLEACYYEPS